MARVDNLDHFLTDVADAIRTKTGSQETIQASDFDTEIENIPSGGVGTIDTPAKLTEEVMNLCNNLHNYYTSIVNSYTVSTSEAVTLYTPNANYKWYIIMKRSSGGYRVCWYNTDCRLWRYFNYGEYIFQPFMYMQNNGSSIKKIDGTITYIKYEDFNTSFPPKDTFYYSNELETAEDCVAKMQSNELTYTSYDGTWAFAPEQANPVPYSNLAIFRNSTGAFLTTPTRISSNETITVIPS